MNQTQSLNGRWEYRIGKGKFTSVTVPFSTHPVGHSECKRKFDLEYNSEKIFLQLDGVAYEAKVSINGRFLGEMLPYSEYKFDITEFVKVKDNELLVELEDIAPEFGPTAGWQNYGGIIRDVELQYRDDNYIEDVFAHSMLLCDYTEADFVVETKCSLPLGAEFKIELSYKNETVLSYIQSAEGDFIHQRVKEVRLWSPDSPEMYQLDVYLLKERETLDFYSCNIGFREFSCDRHRFLLNGKPLFLKGVCKHEMYGESGHCPTEEQMLEDMCHIKEIGCNFVRLVHYPHNKKMIDIADRLGLFVSEEPGLWWSDTANPKVSGGSLEVLKRTILRDRNHPSIAFWLSFNECRFTEQFLIDSAKICRKYDPTRLVSGANCMSIEETLKYYNICGYDFYTMHPYSQTVDLALESAGVLNDKPLLFTEWGGHFVYNNPKLLSEFMEEMSRLYREASDEGALAGAFFWCWAEIKDYNRRKPPCVDGTLCEGLLTSARKPTLIYETFCECLRKMGEKEEEAEFWFEPVDDTFSSKRALALGNQNRSFEAFFAKVAEAERTFVEARFRELKAAPILKGIPRLKEVPLLIADKDEFNVDCSLSADELELIGAVSMVKGYPLLGAYGEEVAVVRVQFENGAVEEYTLRNGIDITTIFATNQSSWINPVAENAKRAAYFGYDKSFENYILNSLKINVKNREGGDITRISIKSSDNGYALLIYGIFY